MKTFLFGPAQKSLWRKKGLGLQYLTFGPQHWRTRDTLGRQPTRPAHRLLTMDAQQDYRDWSHERLVERVTQLEQALKKKTLKQVICPIYWSVEAWSDLVIVALSQSKKGRRRLGLNVNSTLFSTILG